MCHLVMRLHWTDINKNIHNISKSENEREDNTFRKRHIIAISELN